MYDMHNILWFIATPHMQGAHLQFCDLGILLGRIRVCPSMSSLTIQSLIFFDKWICLLIFIGLMMMQTMIRNPSKIFYARSRRSKLHRQCRSCPHWCTNAEATSMYSRLWRCPMQWELYRVWVHKSMTEQLLPSVLLASVWMSYGKKLDHV